MNRNSWPKGFRHLMSPSEHDEWNARNYPGTRQLCTACDAPTGQCEEDSFYADNGEGPLCRACWDAAQTDIDSA